MATPTGLRERKKQQTRELIAQTARRLFLERGFDQVPVAEIARAADVSEKTVFNYFPRKEDLVYFQLESFEEQLLGAVRDRAPGESVLDAFRQFVLRQRGLLAEPDPEAAERLAALTRMITESPALLAREREIFERYADALAALLAEETGPGPTTSSRAWSPGRSGRPPALVDFSRTRIVAGERGPRLQRQVRAQGKRALETLGRGLQGYGARG